MLGPRRVPLMAGHPSEYPDSVLRSRIRAEADLQVAGRCHRWPADAFESLDFPSPRRARHEGRLDHRVPIRQVERQGVPLDPTRPRFRLLNNASLSSGRSVLRGQRLVAENGNL